jgi:hypothetical protein
MFLEPAAVALILTTLQWCSSRSRMAVAITGHRHKRVNGAGVEKIIKPPKGIKPLEALLSGD